MQTNNTAAPPPAGGYFTFQEEPMPKTKFQNVVFTAIMAICMVYGMIVIMWP